jgi:hypothetical protein
MDDAAAHRLDVYEIACLAAGPDRVVDTALVALVESGRVRVTAPGCLATSSLVRRHPVEAAVLDAIGPTGTRSVDTVRWRLTADARILDVPRHLRDAGLTAPGGPAALPARRSRWRVVPTYAGRHLLHELQDDPPVDDVAPGTSAMTVALHGRERMPDQALRRSIFDPPPSPVAGAVKGKPPPELDWADHSAARRTRDRILAEHGHGGGLLGPL